jgi:hypothetical protein
MQLVKKLMLKCIETKDLLQEKDTKNFMEILSYNNNLNNILVKLLIKKIVLNHKSIKYLKQL